LSSKSKPSADIASSIGAILQDEGFSEFGFAELKQPFSIALYEEWLEKGFHGEMDYLVRHLPLKKDPQSLLNSQNGGKARSAIVVTKNYVPHPEPIENWPILELGTIAAYARGKDYHHFLKASLARVIERLQVLLPNEVFCAYTDSAPVLERDLAARAGLGWIGKNTCVISRQKGSLFFLAEIYTSLDPALLQPPEKPGPDHCGTCTRCIDACPTKALVAPRVLDARRCISYLTIESREIPPEELREGIGSCFFGCDICQNVCPWNKKPIATANTNENSNLNRDDLVNDLQFVLRSSGRSLEKAFLGTPLSRAGSFGLKRNALVVAANLNLTECLPEIDALLDHERLGELAKWAKEKLLRHPKTT
jgi:epoxyqueuosine reductase